MARKDLLKGLMAAHAPAPADDQPSRVDAARPRYGSGAIGAVSQSIADLKSRSVQDIDPRMIDEAGVKDRLDSTTGHAELVESIREYGQQVPVLLRPNPNYPERYQVVYGRRRVAALRDLGIPVKALIRVLDDRELILAQGQENGARRDLSFIEKVNFARQMRDMGYERKIICDALHIDKTLISRMFSVADRVPDLWITAIGAAPSIGRERWLALADLVEKAQPDDDVVRAKITGDSSDERFDAAFKALTPAKSRAAPALPTETRLVDQSGAPLGSAKRSRNKLVITVDAKSANGFDEWLVANMSEIHRRWKDDTGE